jgi:hypothetical protein
MGEPSHSSVRKRLFSEPDNLFFSLSLILWKGHPLANDFAARLVVFF